MTTTMASFNVENLFARPRAFAAETTSEGQQFVADYREFNELIGKDIYSGPDRDRMRQLLLAVDVYYRNQHGAIRRKAPRNARWAWLRKNRGRSTGNRATPPVTW